MLEDRALASVGGARYNRAEPLTQCYAMHIVVFYKTLPIAI